MVRPSIDEFGSTRSPGEATRVVAVKVEEVSVDHAQVPADDIVQRESVRCHDGGRTLLVAAMVWGVGDTFTADRPDGRLPAIDIDVAATGWPSPT